MANILIAEDEAAMAEIIADYMRRGGHACFAARDGAEALAILSAGPMDLMILDVMMPHLDGFSVCKMAREMSNMPIIMLTAKGAEEDKLRGYDYGADDYMTKPFAPEELLARLRALTRRQGQGEPPALQGLAFADLRLDPSARSLHREGKSVQLSPKEFELLRLLMGRAGAVCPKGEILDRLWGGAEDNNLEAYISFLRKKFFYLGSRASIATLRKVGYRLDDPDRPA